MSQPSQSSPKVFISYSRDSPEHNEWVLQLARRLRQDGVDAILDVWDLRPGDDIKEKHTEWISSSNAVLMIITERYLDAVSKDSFLGYETALLRKVMLSTPPRPRVIPLMRGVHRYDSLPKWLEGRYSLLFTDPASEEENYPLLLDTLLEKERAPALGLGVTRGSSDEAPAMRVGPVALQSLEIHGFRALENFTLSLGPRAKDSGQWTLLLGDNGVGKSSILWATALALAGEELGHGVVAGLSTPLVRSDAEGARIGVTLETATSGLRIGRGPRSERLKYFGAEWIDFPIFGYGSSRGSARGGPRRDVELERPLDSIGTLFGLGTYLVHAESWLQGLDYSSLKESAGGRSFFEAVRDTLIDILPGVEELVMDPEDILVRGPAIGECSLSSLSDGYLTTLGWVVDLMARWSHQARKMGLALAPRFNEQMHGLVLIDEIDLHLHPKWQTQIVSDLRRAFPKMSFIATTHNPLTLLGAQPGEVHVLRRENGELTVSQVDLPPGIRADQVLTGVWFGLSSTLDEETQELLEQHRRMLGEGVDRTDAERLELEQTLRRRLGSYADTSQDRLAQETVARYMNEQHREDQALTDQERSELKDHILDALRAAE